MLEPLSLATYLGNISIYIYIYINTYVYISIYTYIHFSYICVILLLYFCLILLQTAPGPTAAAAGAVAHSMGAKKSRTNAVRVAPGPTDQYTPLMATIRHIIINTYIYEKYRKIYAKFGFRTNFDFRVLTLFLSKLG